MRKVCPLPSKELRAERDGLQIPATVYPVWGSGLYYAYADRGKRHFELVKIPTPKGAVNKIVAGIAFRSLRV